MTFDVGGTVTWKGKPQIWSGCELNFEGSYPGWLLDNGEGPELFTDAKHELVFAEGSGSVDEGFPVFAAGTNDFAPFVSMGRCIRLQPDEGEDGGEKLQLTLARRYVTEKDERAG
eukprot:CAMPEP_0177748202 /NCGR_PEP_ID=MMETSP0484_2-20121128/31809_1 /TAXON_ID=354590 /ORGANISM="Rhodomonas lens, Strain RHODO" /LENGTH=114 /DNA_ID=CAMNT_0019263067 /DNA_START=18 /DNA_END=358 /DNA_ORIENTATION=-